MAINRAKLGLNFSGGIDAVSYLNSEKTLPNLPQSKRIIYFNEDSSPSNLSKLFTCFKGNKLVDKACRLSKDEFEHLQTEFSGRQAMNVLDWLSDLDAPLDPQIKEQAQEIFTLFAELELKEQIQRNLLKQV